MKVGLAVDPARLVAKATRVGSNVGKGSGWRPSLRLTSPKVTNRITTKPSTSLMGDRLRRCGRPGCLFAVLSDLSIKANLPGEQGWKPADYTA